MANRLGDDRFVKILVVTADPTVASMIVAALNAANKSYHGGTDTLRITITLACCDGVDASEVSPLQRLSEYDCLVTDGQYHALAWNARRHRLHDIHPFRASLNGAAAKVLAREVLCGLQRRYTLVA